MSLGEINDKLYRRTADEDLGKIDPTEFDPRVHLDDKKTEPISEDDRWHIKEKPKSKRGFFKNKAVRIGLYIFGGIVLVLISVGGFYKINQAAFSQERVTIKVDGPLEIRSGNLVTYEVDYKNDNRASLKNVVIKISYPESFKLDDNPNFKTEGPISGAYFLGDVPSNSESKVLINGRINSPKGALVYIKAEMTYSPSSLSSQFVAKNQLGVNVVSTPLSIEILAPQNVATGDEVNYMVTYKNDGEEAFDGIKVQVDYPEGFTFSSSDPKASEGNNIWYIGNILPSQEGKIVVTGKLEGNRDEVKNIAAHIGSTEKGAFVSYNEQNTSTKIAASPLIISQIVNGVSNLTAKPGDFLKFELNYKNVGDVGLRDVIINETLDSPVLEYTSLSKVGGSFDDENKLLTFKASDFPGLKYLEPGQGGVIRFTIKVKEVIPVLSGNDKNFVISSLAKIDSPDISTPVSMNKIIAGNKMDIKLNSKLVLDVKGYYNDANISNSGPIPPKVNEETTYTLHWIVTNVSNDVTDARVEAVLPTNATATGKFYPDGANITYNERNNSIVWDIGTINAGTGVLTPSKEASFQVRIKPSLDQKGKEVDLLGVSNISAKDSFTGEILTAKTLGKKTALPEDTGLSYNQRVVD